MFFFPHLRHFLPAGVNEFPVETFYLGGAPPLPPEVLFSPGGSLQGCLHDFSYTVNMTTLQPANPEASALSSRYVSSGMLYST